MTFPKHKKIRLGLCAVGTASALVAWADTPTKPPEGVEFHQQERNKWRISAGPAFNFNVRSRLGFKTGPAIDVLSQIAIPQQVVGERQAAHDRITGASDPKGVKRYAGGGWIDPSDSRDDKEENTTWNFEVPSAAKLISDGQMTLSSVPYTETYVRSVTTSGASSSEDFTAPGVNIEVSRELYYDEKWRYGVDLSLGFSWFMRKDCFDANGEVARREDTSTTVSGHWEEKFDVGNKKWDIRDEYGDYPISSDGVLGTGTYDGPGPVLKFPGDIRDVIDNVSSRTDVHSIWADACGDYNEFEFIAALRPFYEPWDWLRVYGTFGVGLSYMRLSYRETLSYNGTDVWSARNVENDFDVYGVAGLGAQVNYKQFLLGFDFLARMWADDLEFESRLLRGSISRGSWMFRCYFGFEF